VARRLGFGPPVWGVFVLALPVLASSCSKIYRHTWMEMAAESTGSAPAEVHKNAGGHAYWLVAEVENTVIRVSTDYGGFTELWVGPPLLPILPRVGNWSVDTTVLHLVVEISFSRDLDVPKDVTIDLRDCLLHVTDHRVGPNVAEVRSYSVHSQLTPVPVDSHRFVLGQGGHTVRLTFHVESSGLPDVVTLELPRFNVGDSNVLLPRIRLTKRQAKDYEPIEVLF